MKNKTVKLSTLLKLALLIAIIFSVKGYTEASIHKEHVRYIRERAKAQAVCYRLKQQELKSMGSLQRYYTRLKDYVNN